MSIFKKIGRGITKFVTKAVVKKSGGSTAVANTAGNAIAQTAVADKFASGLKNMAIVGAGLATGGALSGALGGATAAKGIGGSSLKSLVSNLMTKGSASSLVGSSGVSKVLKGIGAKDQLNLVIPKGIGSSLLDSGDNKAKFLGAVINKVAPIITKKESPNYAAAVEKKSLASAIKHELKTGGYDSDFIKAIEQRIPIKDSFTFPTGEAEQKAKEILQDTGFVKKPWYQNKELMSVIGVISGIITFIGGVLYFIFKRK